MAGKKETVAKVQNKVAKKTTEKPQAEVQNKIRHFSIIYGGVKLAATPSGKRPKQAANKALTSIFGSMDEATKKKLIGQEIKFCLYENCKRKKNAKGELLDRRIFHYTGKRTETAKMTGGKTVEISHEVVVYCDKCKDLIEKLRTIDPNNILTKKQVNKNIKLYKKYIKTVGKKPALNDHINSFVDEYKKIVECKDCKREQKTITYKFTNTVKKTDIKDYTEEDKKITSQFIDQIENNLKDEKKKKEVEKVEKVDKVEKVKKVKKEEKKEEKKEDKKEEKKSENVEKKPKKTTPKKQIKV